MLLVGSPGVGSRLAKCRHHVFGKQVLRLDAFPMFQSAKIGDNGQFSDAALCGKFAHLTNHFLRRSDETNFLLHDLIVGQLGKRFERAARIKAVTLRIQLSFLLSALDGLNRRCIKRQKIVQGLFNLFTNLFFIFIDVNGTMQTMSGSCPCSAQACL